MASRVTWLSTLSIVSTFFLLFATGPTADAIDPDSWDLVTANKFAIMFVKNGTIVQNSTDAVFKVVRTIAYNSANRTLYIAGKSGGHEVISGLNLDEANLTPRIIPICEKPRMMGVMEEMAFDPVTNTLIWYGLETEVLSKMNVASDGYCSEVETVVDLPGVVVQRIALDICNRFIYWAYWSEKSIQGKVERVRLDGTDRKEIVSALPETIAFAVDDYAEKLYFGSVDPFSFKFTIEESNLNGTGRRRLLVNGTDQQPLRLAVDETAVYWTQKDSGEIWKVYKNGTGMRVVASSTESIEGVILTPGNADCERSDGSSSSSSSFLDSDSHVPNDGSSSLRGVDPMVVLLPQALAILMFLYRQTRIGLW